MPLLNSNACHRVRCAAFRGKGRLLFSALMLKNNGEEACHVRCMLHECCVMRLRPTLGCNRRSQDFKQSLSDALLLPRLVQLSHSMVLLLMP